MKLKPTLILLILGLLASACNGTAIAAPVTTATPTVTASPSRSTPVGLPPTAIASHSGTATVTLTPSITPTFGAAGARGGGGARRGAPEWARQGPGSLIVPILLYHHIAVSPINSQYYVPPDKFEDQLRLLRDWGYTTISTQILAKAITEGAPLPPKPIIISFDDGDRSVYENGFPLMQKYGFTGAFYLVSNYLNTDGFVTTMQVKEMAAAGWEIGSHGISHLDLTTLDSATQRKEIVESRKRLEAELGVPVLTIAYPFGFASSGVIDYAIFAGYSAGMGLGFTNDQGETNLFFLQRRDIKGTYDIKNFILFLPWQGDPIYIPTDTPTPTPTASRTPIPTYTQYPTKTPVPTDTPMP
jgi:peptidoglycan/xylan/chitin deacetylase (PgdA/CDA1 family)